jgi:hypothetical protein
MGNIIQSTRIALNRTQKHQLLALEAILVGLLWLASLRLSSDLALLTNGNVQLITLLNPIAWVYCALVIPYVYIEFKTNLHNKAQKMIEFKTNLQKKIEYEFETDQVSLLPELDQILAERDEQRVKKILLGLFKEGVQVNINNASELTGVSVTMLMRLVYRLTGEGVITGRFMDKTILLVETTMVQLVDRIDQFFIDWVVEAKGKGGKS